jgi:hypothetical protein
MIPYILRTRVFAFAATPARLGILVFCVAMAWSLAAIAQMKSQPAPAAASPDTQAAPAPAPSPTPVLSGTAQQAEPGETTEEELRRLLVGKVLFLRDGYLDNTLSFNEHGALIGHSPQGSYTLCEIQINKVRLTRHKVELDGDRYALHFLGGLPYEDPTRAVDRVKITPKKKLVRITIDRELVVKPKEKKEKEKSAWNASKTASPPQPVAAATATAPSQPEQASEAQAEIATAPAVEHPDGSNSVTVTTSPAHANKVLFDALNNVFAQGFDARMIASMPGFWKLYYEAAAEKTDYRPGDPAVLS